MNGRTMTQAAPPELEHDLLLQPRLVGFVRAFGLHRPDETPCGAPVPVSEAHAVSVLAEHGPLSQTDLARHLALRKSTVSRLVDQVVGRRRRVRPGAEGPTVSGAREVA
jgi:MarR family